MAETTTRNGSVGRSQRLRLPRRHWSPAENNQYQALFSRLQSSGYVPSGTRRTVGIISTQRHEGVTTVAGNLALEAAGSFGLPVLLIDANHANPCIDRMFQLKQSPGLSELINGEVGETDCIQDMSARPLRSWPAVFRQKFRRSRNIFGFLNSGNNDPEMPRLSVMPAGAGFSGLRNNGNQAGENVLDRASADFDLVVVDLPPAGSAIGCGFPLSDLDGIVFVLEAEKTSDNAARRSLQQIKEQGAEVIGIAFNKCRYHLPKWIDNKLGD